MPQKVFDLTNEPIKTVPPVIPPKLSVLSAFDRVSKILSVASKRYLTNKVDRCVTGLIAQQQCVGPLHTPLADFGMIALSHFDIVGSATSIGTQPIKGLINPAAGARMSVGEALTNLVFAGITSLSDVKCSANWMWSGKTGSEGGKLAVACEAMCKIMSELEIAIDGGKDSLSMSAGVNGKTVKSPGTLVISTYAPCPDVTVKVEPYLKIANSKLLWVPISYNRYRLGGSALAQSFKQQGGECPDVDRPSILKSVFSVTQELIKDKKILSGHDISDGGLITAVLEMAFAGVSGVQLDLKIPTANYLEALFNEELGLILEVDAENVDYCIDRYEHQGNACHMIGTTGYRSMQAAVQIIFNDELVLDTQLYKLYKMWEEVSYRLELLQANPVCVKEEWKGFVERSGPTYHINFKQEEILLKTSSIIRVAVIREEGTNGDREMIASLMKAQFEVYDVTMHDLSMKSITLDRFRGVVFPGGFSYADTLGSAKGWAASILFNDDLRAQFNNFAFTRKNTFSLGVCNGCQLMALIGWIGTSIDNDSKTSEIVLDHNKSERFECRWSCVSIGDSIATDVWFYKMNSSRLGIWVAHGEGRFTFKDDEVLKKLTRNKQICLRYVDDRGSVTEKYPMNPNGSPEGIASICSMDGRHLAMMPHPERCTLTWQCPYPMPYDTKSLDSPWQKMFENAYEWAEEN